MLKQKSNLSGAAKRLVDSIEEKYNDFMNSSDQRTTDDYATLVKTLHIEAQEVRATLSTARGDDTR